MVAGNLKEPGANSLWKWNKNKQAHYKYTQYKRQKSTIEITGKIDDDQVVVNVRKLVGEVGPQLK